MVVLPDGKETSRICLLVSTEYMNVSDRQTDRETDRHPNGQRTTAQAAFMRGKNYCFHTALLSFDKVAFNRRR